jgi:membrane-associated HD superfamily phosphohydrolase
MRRAILTTIMMAGALMPGTWPTLAQTATGQPQAAPATAQNPATIASSATTAAARKRTTTAAARRRRRRAHIRARRRAQRSALLSQKNQAQALRNAPAPTEPAAENRDTEQDASLVQQQEQAARLTSEQQQVLHAYIKAQRQMQEEPRIQDSLGDQPPPYAPVIPPHAASQDTQGIQEAPGPAQTTPKPVPPPAQPPPSSQQNQAPPTSQPQSEPPE